MLKQSSTSRLFGVCFKKTAQQRSHFSGPSRSFGTEWPATPPRDLLPALRVWAPARLAPRLLPGGALDPSVASAAAAIGVGGRVGFAGGFRGSMLLLVFCCCCLLKLGALRFQQGSLKDLHFACPFETRCFFNTKIRLDTTIYKLQCSGAYSKDPC